MSVPSFRKRNSPSQTLVAKPQARPAVSSLWRNVEALATTQELPALPLESLESLALPSAIHDEKQRKALEETIAQLKNSLRLAQRSAILARSQSLELPKRQKLCQKAWEDYETALRLRAEARRLSGVLTLEDRRRIRSLEGAPEWRAIKHAIHQAADLNRVRLSVAA